MQFPGRMKMKNVMTFTPSGFKSSIDVPFPDRTLSVCVRCKKNYKTRQYCRVRDGHTALSSSLTYVCITLDMSCTDENGQLIDGPFVARPLPPQPYSFRDKIESATPTCAACKEKNYTRSYCRQKRMHKQLPWSTNYVILCAAKPGSSPTSGADNSHEHRRINLSEGDGKKSNGKRKQRDSSKSSHDEDDDDQEDEDASVVGDNFDEIPPSRTFLCKIWTECNTIHWLDIDTAGMKATEEMSWQMVHEKHFNSMQNMPNNGMKHMNEIPQAPYQSGPSQVPPSMRMMGGWPQHLPQDMLGNQNIPRVDSGQLHMMRQQQFGNMERISQSPTPNSRYNGSENGGQSGNNSFQVGMNQWGGTMPSNGMNQWNNSNSFHNGNGSMGMNHSYDQFSVPMSPQHPNFMNNWQGYQNALDHSNDEIKRMRYTQTQNRPDGHSNMYQNQYPF